jgi:hypothetical protein
MGRPQHIQLSVTLSRANTFIAASLMTLQCYLTMLLCPKLFVLPCSTDASVNTRPKPC